MKKIQLSLPAICLISICTPIIPIHFIPLEDIKWITWIDPQHIFTLQYPLFRLLANNRRRNIKIIVICHIISEVLIKILLMMRLLHCHTTY